MEKDNFDFREYLAAGVEHIPPFLIASITGSCNLHCEGVLFQVYTCNGRRPPIKVK